MKNKMELVEFIKSFPKKIYLARMEYVSKCNLKGKVKLIGSQIAKKDILDTDPTTATDARVIEIKIQLDEASSKKVANLINLQVNVEINI